jgi:hypothetical protein
MNSYGYGNLIDFGRTISADTQNNVVKYPFIFVVPQGISYDMGTTTYQLSIIFADILNTDYSNEKDCVSDMSLQSKRFISSIVRGLNGENPDMYENMDIEMPVQAIPFFERFGDHVAGVALNTNIIVFEDINDCNFYVPPTPTTSVYSQVLTFTGTPNYNSIQYRCSGVTVEACYSIENQNTMVDLVDLFNSPPPDPLPGSCDNPTFCYCWTDYGTYYDNGDGRIRCEMPTSLYNTLCPSGTLTLNVIND